MPTAVQNALMLCLTGYDMSLLATTSEKSRYTFDAHVVALRSTAREDDLLGVSTNKTGNLLSRCLYRFVRFPSIGVRP